MMKGCSPRVATKVASEPVFVARLQKRFTVDAVAAAQQVVTADLRLLGQVLEQLPVLLPALMDALNAPTARVAAEALSVLATIASHSQSKHFQPLMKQLLDRHVHSLPSQDMNLILAPVQPFACGQPPVMLIHSTRACCRVPCTSCPLASKAASVIAHQVQPTTTVHQLQGCMPSSVQCPAVALSLPSQPHTRRSLALAVKRYVVNHTAEVS